jgi:glycosyltransferase involved in cell wall biosynthesis
MERIPSTPPTIPPLPPDAIRPLFSVMIPVYNCIKYIPEVLQSVMDQDMGAATMQIEVVDDASGDGDIATLVQTIGKGRIHYYRQPVNVGSIRNFETCINRAKGTLIHILHGDDRLKKGFYKKISSLFSKFPEVGAAFCSYSFIDENGTTTHIQAPESTEDCILKNWLFKIAEKQRIQYVSIVVKREVYEKLGSFYGTNYGEDWEMWVRIARSYQFAYTPDVYAEYRGHFGSLSWQKIIEGKNILDVSHAMELIKHHLPEKSRQKTIKKAKEHCAYFSIGMANAIWRETHDKSLAQIQIKHAWIFSKNFFVFYKIFKFYVKTTFRIF